MILETTFQYDQNDKNIKLKLCNRNNTAGTMCNIEFNASTHWKTPCIIIPEIHFSQLFNIQTFSQILALVENLTLSRYFK